MLDKSSLQQNIIALLGLGSLPNDKKIAFLEKLTTVIQKRVTLRVLALVPEDKKGLFVESIIGNNDPTVIEVVNKYVPNLDDIIQEEVLKTKQDLSKAINK